jgi:predicted unusual protein kinase regulating ubiquinone biosynthesis (AarF/ABC1/UbiB family)
MPKMNQIFASRYRRIEFFFAHVIATIAFWDLLLPRLGLRSIAKRTRSARLRRIASRYRALANELGGLLIKVGQFLSARVDVLPEEITSELSTLQDEVRAEKFQDIRPIVEKELNGTLEALFAEFDETPLAAASLGQVHRAKLREPSNDVQSIVVKAQRPNIEKIVATDLAAIRTVIGWLNHYRPIRKRANLDALLVEFTRILEGELDYLAEGRNAETSAENFRDLPEVRVPRVLWTHTTKRVLALEDVYAIKITDYDAITAAGVDRAQVAERLFKTYLKQIFDDGFFHADPHPGNLFVLPLGESENGKRPWRLTFVDFGMVGRVSPNVRAGLRELVIAVGMRDASRMIKGYQQLGVLLPGADIAQIEKMEAKVFERFWGKTMSELQQMRLQEMKEFANEFREVIVAAPFQIPEDLVLLGRTVAILSGMCTGLNPQFNVWQSIAPFAEELFEEDGIVDWRFWAEELATFVLALLSLPMRTRAVLGKIERGELQVRVPRLEDQVSRLDLTIRRLTATIVFVGLLFSGVQLYLGGEKIFASGLFAIAGIALIWLIVAKR